MTERKVSAQVRESKFLQKIQSNHSRQEMQLKQEKKFRSSEQQKVMKKWTNFKAILETTSKNKDAANDHISFHDATSEVEFIDKVISSGSSNSDLWSDDTS